MKMNKIPFEKSSLQEKFKLKKDIHKILSDKYTVFPWLDL